MSDAEFLDDDRAPRITEETHDEYHQRTLGVVSKSVLDLIDRSPSHYKHWVETGEEERSPALIFGSAFHCALLEPDRFKTAYAVAPSFGDCRKKENKAARDAWRAEHKGAEHLDAEDGKAIADMVIAVHRHPLASRMIRDGRPEMTLRWTDPATGLACKSRADYFVERLGAVFDAKTTTDARPKAFARDCATYRYHVQDALYREAFRANGIEVANFVFICVEKLPPHAIALFQLDERSVERGRERARENIETMHDCITSGEWPGYSTSIQTIELPPWAG